MEGSKETLEKNKLSKREGNENTYGITDHIFFYFNEKMNESATLLFRVCT